jgi:hypothetical protein
MLAVELAILNRVSIGVLGAWEFVQENRETFGGEAAGLM